MKRLLTDMANNIRIKTKSNDLIMPKFYPNKIMSIRNHILDNTTFYPTTMEETFEDMAEAIRIKSGRPHLIRPVNMPFEISQIPVEIEELRNQMILFMSDNYMYFLISNNLYESGFMETLHNAPIRWYGKSVLGSYTNNTYNKMTVVDLSFYRNDVKNYTDVSDTMNTTFHFNFTIRRHFKLLRLNTISYEWMNTRTTKATATFTTNQKEFIDRLNGTTPYDTGSGYQYDNNLKCNNLNPFDYYTIPTSEFKFAYQPLLQPSTDPNKFFLHGYRGTAANWSGYAETLKNNVPFSSINSNGDTFISLYLKSISVTDYNNTNLFKKDQQYSFNSVRLYNDAAEYIENQSFNTSYGDMELLYNTDSDIIIKSKAKSNIPYKWRVSLDNNLIGVVSGITNNKSFDMITIPNSTSGLHTVKLENLREEEFYEARSLHFENDNTLIECRSDGRLFNGDGVIPTEAFIDMFKNCKFLTLAPTLPSMTLGQGCYRGMLYGTSALTIPPQLPATTLVYDCYRAMFRGSGITELTLPATTLAYHCYLNLARECNSLTKVVCYSTSNLSIDLAGDTVPGPISVGGWLAQITTVGAVYSPNAVVTYALPTKWTAKDLSELP